MAACVAITCIMTIMKSMKSIDFVLSSNYAIISSIIYSPLTAMGRMEVASSRLDHPQTLSAAKTSELSLLVKSPFGWRCGRCRHYCSDFSFIVPAKPR